MIVYLQMIEGEENKRQFAALYETYRGLMFYTANNILHNSQDAEDARHNSIKRKKGFPLGKPFCYALFVGFVLVVVVEVEL